MIPDEVSQISPVAVVIPGPGTGCCPVLPDGPGTVVHKMDANKN